MDIKIYKSELTDKFIIRFDDITKSGQEFGSILNLTQEEMRTLNELITVELKEVDDRTNKI